MMRKFVAAIIISSLFVPAAAYSLSDAPEMPEWMTGAWGHEDKEGWADEYWTPPRGDMMIGASRSGKDEKLNFWEQMRNITFVIGCYTLQTTNRNRFFINSATATRWFARSITSSS